LRGSTKNTKGHEGETFGTTAWQPKARNTMSDTQPTSHGVPAPLMRRLHEANEAFSRARAGLDSVLASPTHTSEEVQVAGDALRAAERELEEVTRAIHPSIG
jgi:hypothetical protein